MRLKSIRKRIYGENSFRRRIEVAKRTDTTFHKQAQSKSCLDTSLAIESIFHRKLSLWKFYKLVEADTQPNSCMLFQTAKFNNLCIATVSLGER